MPEVSNKTLYEGLFLLSPGAVSDLAGSFDTVRGIIERHGGEIITLRRWDDRRLAYAIRGQKRGTFLLSYFEIDGRELAAIERELHFSESITRQLILRADHVGEVELELEKKEAGNNQPPVQAADDDDDADESREEITDEVADDEDTDADADVDDDADSDKE